MERETKVIKTENHQVEIKTYLTAGERREIRNVYLKGLKLNIEGVVPKISEFPPELITEAENKVIETVIVSIDGSKENILQRFLEFKIPEYEQVMAEIDKVSGGAEFEVKKKT